MTPSAAANPKALPPANTTACAQSTRLPGRRTSVSLVPGAPPRTEGVRALLVAMVPATRLQWLRVGRVVGVWRVERPDISTEAREEQIASARKQFDALGRALHECAAAEGRTLRPEPEIVPFVWSTLMGLADLHAQGWVRDIDEQRLTDIAINAIVDHVLEPDRGATSAHP